MRETDAKKLGQIVTKIQESQFISRGDAYEAFKVILSDDSKISALYWGALFSSIQTRGVIGEEILGFVDAVLDFDPSLRALTREKQSVPVELPVVAATGSGKETFKTFNITTAAAVVASCCGVCVVKPGSSSTSAVSGSKEVLSALGVRINPNLEEAIDFLKQLGICFLDYGDLAPHYAEKYDGRFFHFHPLSYIMPPLAVPFKVDSLVYGIANRNVAICASLLRSINYE